MEEKFNGRIKIVRNSKREGLIRTRLHGAKKATGEALVFLDSHVEVMIGWLEPLLDLIRQNDTNVAAPSIQILDQDTFRFGQTARANGGFNWNMHFSWDPLPLNISQSSNPYKSPTMVRTLIDFTYYTRILNFNMF